MQLTDDAKGRSYLFDNYKALLIFLVVTGHMIDPAYGNTSAIDFVKWYIFAFHMPAFLFITGFFSKRKKAMGTLIQKVFGALCDISDLILSGIHLCNRNKSGFGSVDSEVFPLVSVVCFRIQGYNTICYEDSLPRCNGHHRCLGLVIGFWPFADNLLSIPRIVYFYPFYLTGVYLNMDTVHKLRRKGGRIVSAIFVIALQSF